MDQLSSLMHLDRGPELRRHRRIFDNPVELLEQPGGLYWPMYRDEICPFKPPWPSPAHAEAMRLESARRLPNEDLGPLAKQWTIDLQAWYFKLQEFFGFDHSDLAKNIRNSRHRWARRLDYLRASDPQQYRSIMDDISVGHRIPFSRQPKRFFRRRNPPSLAQDKDRAWAAIAKDMSHGALRPVNISSEGIPHCVCPVRTAEKSDGSARFVHNSRRVNKCIRREDVECELESLLKTRNIYIPGGYAIGSDFASGYHCISMLPEHRKYLAFALHTSELPREAIALLRKEYPDSYCKSRDCFIFVYLALPFGLSSSCKSFNRLITALAGFWRRCCVGGEPVRASSYIDDIISIQREFMHSIEMAILMVFEAASLGLLFKIPKCSFFPKTRIVTLGTKVDLEAFRFAVSVRRARKLRDAITDLAAAVKVSWDSVPAKKVASVIGLIWSIAPCCHRAAGVMLRAITQVLTENMRRQLQAPNLSLRAILSMFWSGTVAWSKDADRQLAFWARVPFETLSAPISADVLGKSAELLIRYPARFNPNAVSFACQDASETASGGGLLRVRGHELVHSDEIYLAEFDEDGCKASSTWREIQGIQWCLRSMVRVTRQRIVFLCDNFSSCQAILRGSSIPRIQGVAESAFSWSIRHGVAVWPVWLPRSDPCIQEADRRSRLNIPHDYGSPTYLVRAANRLAAHLWDEQLSFDQAASHRTAIRINGAQLPFNAVCMQPGAAGVDMFRQWQSWVDNVNYVYPPKPMLGRLVTFVQHTKARVIVAFRAPAPSSWWTHAIQPTAPGLIISIQIGEFIVVAYDFSTKTHRNRAHCAGLGAIHIYICMIYGNVPPHSPHTLGSKASREEALRRMREASQQGGHIL